MISTWLRNLSLTGLITGINSSLNGDDITTILILYLQHSNANASINGLETALGPPVLLILTGLYPATSRMLRFPDNVNHQYLFRCELLLK